MYLPSALLAKALLKMGHSLVESNPKSFKKIGHRLFTKQGNAETAEMNHRRMNRAQKAAITDTFLQPYSVRFLLQTKAEDNFLILSTQKAKEVEKQNSASHQILLQRFLLCSVR